MEDNKDFHKYLESSGVKDFIVKILVSLYEEPEKPLLLPELSYLNLDISKNN